MAGQGGPLRFFVSRYLARWRQPLALALLLFMPVGQGIGEEVQLRVRLAWFGGPARSWEGTIRLTSGRLSEAFPLGLEADAPGSMHLIDDGTLYIAPRYPRAYDGVDLEIVAPREASLIIEFQPEGGEPIPAIQWPLETLAKVVQQSNLDDEGNRLVGQRSPGDRLPVTIPRDHLVFSPGEKFEFTVLPRPLDLAPNSSYLLNVALLPARGGSELTSQDREFKTDSAAAPQLEGIFALTLPSDEGIYDVRIALYPKRLGSSLVRGRPVCERRVQLVVLDPALRADPDEAKWETALELDPAQPRWWEKMIRLPSISRIPGFGQQSYGNGRPGVRMHRDRAFVELGVDQWQAYPLAIGDIGRLHMLQIEYPSDLPQSLQVSVVEPNAAGLVVPVGLDTGFEVSPPLPGAKTGMRQFRIPFWPQTKSPLVLLVNRSPKNPAVYGKIRVELGPAKLAPAKLPTPPQPQRMLAVSLDRPFFCENFGAGETLDGPTGQARKDWVTFYQGAGRLVEYVQHSGRNAALIAIAAEGSSLYPSELLAPTGKHDTGLYLESGQDPLRKDVAEMLFRMFDRAGLQLVPAVKFASPLPELEALALNPDEAQGLKPVGADGETWLSRHGTRRGAGVHYNLLDPRVQRAMRRVVAEIAQRYGHHPSFGGVAVHLGPEMYSLLPDETCSLDDATIARFSEETKIAVPGEGLKRYAQRARFLLHEGRSAWLDWRAGQIAQFYQGMDADIARTHAGSRLYLHTGELLASRTLQTALRPALPQSTSGLDALAKMGIDTQRLVGQGTMVIPAPQRLVPTFDPEHDFLLHIGQGSALASDLATGNAQSVLITHFPAELTLPSFEQAGPFPPDKTHTWFIPPLIPAAAASRKRIVHSIAAFDAPSIIDSTWLLPLGQDEAARDVIAVYRRLPADRFQTAQPRSVEDRTQPVTVRTLPRNGKTYFYAVNDSPWPVELEIEFESAEIFRLVSYHPGKSGSLARQASRGTWSVKLDPYDLVGGELTSERVKVATWRCKLPSEAETWLREQIYAARLRAAALRNPAPLEALTNASFELVAADGSISGWTTARGPGAVAELDTTQARSGAASLHLGSRREGVSNPPVVWIRSESFVPPRTGRLSLVAWVKVSDPARQPKLRLVIQGKIDDKSFYQRGNVGASENGSQPRPLGTTWAPIRFPVTNLPLEGLTELSVGFDLMGEGEVWIDDVQLYDLWFEDGEQQELLKEIANADFQLTAGQVADCYRFVEGYWPRFLQEHVTPPPVQAADEPGELFTPPMADSPRNAESPTRRERRKEKEADEKPGMMERMRQWWSKPLFR